MTLCVLENIFMLGVVIYRKLKDLSLFWHAQNPHKLIELS